ncbi:YhdP family protein [Pseudoalteromonas sp. G4]|uniref:YhdP family protein n=1 Tax=Pseudoalteromonas sp. G4 TaxID=2992761 RepID=UPI00237D6430|nr:YhdP family protein [Pseudoalteromonas sp. G4]MDE3271198.1 YhdP family protein [Pseudoalteromonas sp. G4]
MQKVRHACFWCLRKIWQIFAISLVLIAVLVSLLKYSLPYANDYKGEIEALLTEQVGTDIAIGSISAGWEHTGPALVLNQVSFGKEQSLALGLYVEQSRLHVNVWQSVLQRRLVSNYFVLSGLNAKIDLNQPMPSREQSADGANLIDVLETLFLAESGHFAVEDSQLFIKTKRNENRQIAVERVTWQNRNTQHQGVGYITLPGISDNRLEVILDLYGEHFSESFGTLFVESKQLNASSWLQDVLSEKVSGVKSDINFKAWARFKEFKIENVQLDWAPSQITWQQAKDQKSLQINSGTLRLRPNNDAWTLETSELSIGANQSQWPTFGGKLNFLGDNLVAHWRDFPLALVSDIAPLMPFDEIHFAEELKLNGSIPELYIRYHNQQDYFVTGKVEGLSWQHYQGIPGVQNLALEFVADQQAAKLSIQGSDDYLMTGELFSRAIPYQQLDISIDFIKQAEGWQVQSDTIWLHNEELTFAAEFSLDLYAQTELSLYAEMQGPEVLKARHYFPRGYMPQSTIDYLNRSLRGGRIDLAKVLWQGKLSDFPYREHNGRFLVDAKVTDATFNFNQSWPDITDLEADLIFSNERMDIVSKQGELAGLRLGQGVVVSIDDLSHANMLNVDIETTQQAEKLQPFFAATPLNNSVGAVLETIQGQGQVIGKTRIQVPLGKKAGKNGKVDVSGSVDFSNTPIYIAKPGIPFKNLNGTLTFHNSDITLKNANATWLDMPFNFSLEGKQSGENYALSLSGDALWQIKDIVKHTQGVMDGYLTGVVPFDIAFDMTLKPQGFNYNASANSNLIGLGTNLPVPYSKKSDEIWPLSLTVQGDEISNLVTANINKQLFFNSIIDNREGKVTNAHLIVGEKDLGINASGFDVSVHLAKADIVEWIPFIDHLITTPSESSNTNQVFPSLKAVNANIDYATLSEIEFNDLDINLTALAQSTQLKINGKEVRAEVSIPRVLAQRPVYIEADYLRLNFKQQEEVQVGLTPLDSFDGPKDNQWLMHLPAIRFNCADCKIDTYQLDKVILDLDPADNGLLISQLNINKGKHQFIGQGSWQKQKTNLAGKLVSKDIGELTDEFDLTSSIKESNAEIDIDLAWYGTPYEFNTESLSGDLKWRLGDGYITDISDGGARVFSLLSLDSLVRKLKLDFRDVFAKGFFYNSMKGTMQIDKGVAYTKDAELNGVPADLTIKGYADLNTRKIDYTMWVAPEVTSSIPVIVAWMVNPVTGLAALAIDKVLHSARVISEIEYTITGTFEEPVVTEKGKKSREIEIPQPKQDDLPEEKKVVPVTEESQSSEQSTQEQTQ